MTCMRVSFVLRSLQTIQCLLTFDALARLENARPNQSKYFQIIFSFVFNMLPFRPARTMFEIRQQMPVIVLRVVVIII
jgi:hypothetical protein